MSVFAVKGVSVPLIADFGEDYAGLTTVVYRLLNIDGSTVQDWTGAGVADYGQGKYGVAHTFAAVWGGIVEWDTALAAGNTAIEDVVVADVGGLQADVSAIRAAVATLGAPAQASALAAAAAAIAGLGEPAQTTDARLDNLDAPISSRATPADVNLSLDADLSGITGRLDTIEDDIDQLPAIRVPA